MKHIRATMDGAMPMAARQPATSRLDMSWLEDKTALHVLVDVATFQATLEREWQRAIRECHEVSLLMLAVDPCANGDESTRHWALNTVAQVLQARVRRPGDLIARHDVVDFAILLPCTHPLGAKLLAQELCAMIAARQVDAASGDAAITIAIGASGLQPEPDMTSSILVSAALAALADAQSAGGNPAVQAKGRALVGSD